MRGTAMNEIYFPSCNFTKASPEAAQKIQAYLQARMPVAGCCRVDKLEYSPESTAVYFCQACRETLEARVPGKFITKNLFVYLLEQPDFPWPDYSGLTVTVQDCWRDREHPEIFAAVREALGRMQVTVLEMEETKEQSVFCGNLHFEPKWPENLALVEHTPLSQLPQAAQEQLMREQVEKLPCPLAVTCCNRCKLGITMGGGRAVHLLELAMGTFTK